jgi:hypothetical protein
LLGLAVLDCRGRVALMLRSLASAAGSRNLTVAP